MIAYFGSDTPSREVRKEPLKGDMIKTNGLKHREQSSVVNTVESFGCIQQYAMNMELLPAFSDLAVVFRIFRVFSCV